MVFFGVVLGILLIMIGSGVNNEWVGLVGSFFFAASLFWGGLSSGEERVPVRVTMLVFAGLAVFGLLSSGSIMPF